MVPVWFSENNSLFCTHCHSFVLCTILWSVVFFTPTEVPVLMGSSLLLEQTLVQVGNNVTLQCPLMATYPTPSLMWLVNGSVVLENMMNNSITTASDDDQEIYQCLVEASFTTTTNRAGLPPMTSLVTTTFVDVFCKCL